MSLGAGLFVRAEPPSARSAYTDAQATAGQTTYEEFCIACHQADLGGQNEALPLTGTHFFSSWGHRTTRDLFTFISTSMPPGQSTLTDNQYLGLVAYLLRSNGASAGAQALTATAEVSIKSVVPVRNLEHGPGADGR
jgi:mono/diheme cytochrome c family protein